MSLRRLIGCIFIDNGIAVQSIEFKRRLPIGDPRISAEYLNQWHADEICLLDISKNRKEDGPDVDLVRKVAACAFTPLCYGGRISTIQHIHDCIAAGADKVLLNSALDNEELVLEAIDMFGSQAVVAGIDYIRDPDGKCFWYRNYQKTPHELGKVVEYVKTLGFGEILLQSVQLDGTLKGLDIPTLSRIAGNCPLPVIAMGGAGSPKDIADCFKDTLCSAVAVGNMLNYTEHSVSTIKEFLRQHDVVIRPSRETEYHGCCFDNSGRLGKKDESWLDDLGYVDVEREVI